MVHKCKDNVINYIFFFRSQYVFGRPSQDIPSIFHDDNFYSSGTRKEGCQISKKAQVLYD